MKIATLFAAALLFALNSFAANIAIIDSGTDLKHQDLFAKAWTNAKEIPDNGKDDDGNSYVDDVLGWNFAENNNQIIDYKYLNTFSKDVYAFFDVQFKLLTGTATDEDKKWYQEKTKDQNFVAELGKFGNFIHGTHVAGITARDATSARIMGVKIIPTEVGLGIFDNYAGIRPETLQAEEAIDPLTDMLIRMGLDKLADQQMGMLKTVGDYVAKQSMQVANCSFGTSMAQARAILKQILPLVLQRDPTDQEVETYAKVFMDAVVKKAATFVDTAKNTMFVIAAGNDGTDNDQLPASPANVKRPNTITVAATWDYKKLASFSNYGKNMVDIAAPGVGIKSSIPGNEYLRVSGTSQATPYVANVIGRIIDINPKLSFDDIRSIMMQTVDKKDYLADKVKAGGIINAGRALEAARLTVGLSVADAIAKARQTIGDVATKSLYRAASEGYVIPLTPMFVIR